MKVLMINRPKVLLLTDSLENGGAERQLALFAKYIPREWDVRIWSMSDGPYKSLIEDSQVKLDIRERRWKFDIVPAFSLYRLILNWMPDIIHAWGWMSAIAAAPICYALHIPLINGTIRMGMKPPRRSWPQWIGLQLADGVIANSRAGLDAWGISEHDSIVIYNGFDPDRFNSIIVNKKKEQFTIVMAARMTKEKEFKLFIEAARYITRNDKRWQFIAIGSGPDRSHLLDFAQDLIDQNIMVFPAANTEVLPYISSADVGVLLSTPLIHAEGCSNSIIEYMACKLPVVCTRGGGNNEIVIDNQTGFLINASDLDVLIQRLKYLYNNKDLSKQIGELGYKRFIAMFSVQRMVGETLKFYSKYIKS